MAVTAVNCGKISYLTADGIGVPHCFTTRLGGVSEGVFSSLNLGYNRGDDPENVAKNFKILADALGFSAEGLVLTRQTHSAIVRQVTAADALGFDNHAYPECDALITNQPGTALAIFTADCTPILLHDPVTGAVGAVHAGWRGTAAKLAQKTALAMQKAYGCRPEDLCAAIGPNIGQCCFATDRDVPEAMEKAYGDVAKTQTQYRDGKYYVNLKELNAISLREIGVTKIDISDHCTYCLHDLYWSHRYTGGNRGSQGALIVCR